MIELIQKLQIPSIYLNTLLDRRCDCTVWIRFVMSDVSLFSPCLDCAWQCAVAWPH